MVKFSTEQIHAKMAAIHGKNTKPKMVVRRWLWGHGVRYRLNHPRLPGKPDIVMRKYRMCIFGSDNCSCTLISLSFFDFITSCISKNDTPPS